MVDDTLPMNAPRHGLSLVTRADDAGLNLSTNRGIRDAVHVGFVRNVSVLAVGAALDELTDWLPAANVSIGFHACLTCEWEQSPRWGALAGGGKPTPLTLPDGTFAPNWETLRELKPQPVDVEVELTAQLRRLRHAGLTVDYLDEHMCFTYGFPELYPVLCRLARKEGLIYARQLKSLPPAPNKTDSFRSRLHAAPDGTYLVVGHPARQSDEMHQLHLAGKPLGLVAAERTADYLWFTAPETRTDCESASIHLLRYKELPHQDLTSEVGEKASI